MRTMKKSFFTSLFLAVVVSIFALGCESKPVVKEATDNDETKIPYEEGETLKEEEGEKDEVEPPGTEGVEEVMPENPGKNPEGPGADEQE